MCRFREIAAGMGRRLKLPSFPRPARRQSIILRGWRFSRRDAPSLERGSARKSSWDGARHNRGPFPIWNGALAISRLDAYANGPRGSAQPRLPGRRRSRVQLSQGAVPISKRPGSLLQDPGMPRACGSARAASWVVSWTPSASAALGGGRDGGRRPCVQARTGLRDPWRADPSHP